MATAFQPPPTWAMPVLVDEKTGKSGFHPVWLKWFVDLTGVLNSVGGGSGSVLHNSTSGLQGGGSSQYYHITQSLYTALTTGNITLDKDIGTGIKVDITSPSFGWRDLLGQVEARGTGPTDPGFNVFRTNIRAYQFTVGDEVWLAFHVPHDYVSGTDLFIHAHWAVTTAVIETCTWGFDLTYAKGHNQAAFPATVNVTAAQATGGTAYQHYVTEVQCTGGGLLTAADIEVDGLILVRAYLSANTGAIEPFLFMVDLHYQSSNLGTKQKAPNFYV